MNPDAAREASREGNAEVARSKWAGPKLVGRVKL